MSASGGSSNEVENIYGDGINSIDPHLNSQLPPIAHQRSVKSCDFDVINAGVDSTNTSFDTFNHPVPQHHVSQQQINHLHHSHQHQIMNMNNITTAGDLATQSDFYVELVLNYFWNLFCKVKNLFKE